MVPGSRFKSSHTAESTKMPERLSVAFCCFPNCLPQVKDFKFGVEDCFGVVGVGVVLEVGKFVFVGGLVRSF